MREEKVGIPLSGLDRETEGSESTPLRAQWEAGQTWANRPSRDGQREERARDPGEDIVPVSLEDETEMEKWQEVWS
jgi:hypothetical protein